MALSIEPAFAQIHHYQSSEQKNQLIELYTSQGCSSCPPAEHLLTNLVDSEQLWQRYFPIALHVNYWNYLGWSDTYSSAQANEYQQQHFKHSNTSNIYTPQFVVDGNEWRGFFRSAPLPTISNKLAGQLSLQLDDSSAMASMQFANISANIPALCHFALLSFDPHVEITAGENSGLSLSQDFAMLEILTERSEFKNDHYKCATSLTALPRLTQSLGVIKKYALFGWMASQTHRPIQVTGGWLKLNSAAESQSK